MKIGDGRKLWVYEYVTAIPDASVEGEDKRWVAKAQILAPMSFNGEWREPIQKSLDKVLHQALLVAEAFKNDNSYEVGETTKRYQEFKKAFYNHMWSQGWLVIVHIRVGCGQRQKEMDWDFTSYLELWKLLFRSRGDVRREGEEDWIW